MSILTNFANSQFLAARSVIGAETIAIGDGAAVSGVVGELEIDRDYETGGFEVSEGISIAVRVSDFSTAYASDPKTYQGKVATVRGNAYRIDRISKGQHAVTINLISTNQSA